MSILSKIMGRKEETKAANQEAAQATTETVQEAPAAIQTEVATVEVDQVEKPTEDAPANADECHCGHDHGTPVDAVESVPLSSDELKSLHACNYEKIKDRFHKTFVVAKYFWAYVQNPDSPTERKAIKVKRVAEIRASNFMHALTMIGWDSRNVELVDVKDDYDGGIAIKIDGKVVDTMKVAIATLDDVPYHLMTGSQKRALASDIKCKAIASDKVQAILNGKKPRRIVDHAYEHGVHINLKTAKGYVFAKADTDLVSSIRKNSPEMADEIAEQIKLADRGPVDASFVMTASDNQVLASESK